MKQIDVVKAFIGGSVEAEGSNLRIMNDVLVSHDNEIAFRREGYVFMSVLYLGGGVTRIQNLVRKIATKLVECPQDRFEDLKDNNKKSNEVIQAFNKLNGASQIYIR